MDKKNRDENITKKHYGPENADDQSSNAEDANDYVSKVRDKQIDTERKEEYKRAPASDRKAHSRNFDQQNEYDSKDRTKNNS